MSFFLNISDNNLTFFHKIWNGIRFEKNELVLKKILLTFKAKNNDTDETKHRIISLHLGRFI